MDEIEFQPTAITEQDEGNDTEFPIDDDNADDEYEPDQILDNENDEDDEIDADIIAAQPEIRKKLYGKDGRIRTKSRVGSSKPSSGLQLSIGLGRPRGPAIEITEPSPRKFFELFMSRAAIETILLHTNTKILSIQESYPGQNFTYTTTAEEIYALMGVLLFAGVTKNSLLPIEDLFSEMYAPPLFRATMTAARFKFLINCLRFDKWELRRAGKPRPEDNFVHVRELWNTVLQACHENYVPSTQLCVDETMLRFYGRCAFRTYEPRKPDKYGLKVISMTDSKSFYFVNGIPYLGTGDEAQKKEEKLRQKLLREQRKREDQASTARARGSTASTSTSRSTQSVPASKTTRYVLDLIESFQDRKRNITCDNFYMSAELAENLKKYNWTALGTMRKDKREIPAEALECTRKDENIARYFYSDGLTLCSYVAKKGKIVVLLSSGDHAERNHPRTTHPEIVEFYNGHKGGVDAFNEMIKSRTCRRKTRRWPLGVFYFLVDVGAYNSYVLYRKVTGREVRRIQFLKELYA